MNGYLLSIIGTVLLSAVLTSIVPDGKTSSVIKSITKFACILIIISPILLFFQTGALKNTNGENSGIFFSETVIQTDEEFIKYYSELRVNNAETALEAELFEKYSIPVEITFEWNIEEETIAELYTQDKIRILKITAKTNGESGEEVKRAMWEYLTKNYCSEVLIE